MLLPTNIKGRNKIRDAAICLEYENWHDSDAPKTESVNQFCERIGEKNDLTARRIYSILRKNNSYIPIDKEYEKRRRIHWLKRQIARKGDRTQKDAADLIEMLRKEIDGDKATVDMSKHTHITIVNPEGYVPKHERLKAERLSSGLSV